MNMRASERLKELKAEQLEDNPTALVPVHISWDEVMSFNIMQGGQSVDQNTGLREYSKLSEVLKVPEIRNLFIMITDIITSGEPIPEDIAEVMDTPIEQEENGVEPIESDSDPEIQQLEQTGEGRDKVLVMMPEDVVHFLDFLQGGEKTDPTLGLQEFGMLDFITKPAGKFFRGIGTGLGNVFKNNVFRSIVRVGATLAGAYFGGPLGAGVGNMLGRAATGQKPGMDMLMAGGKNALYSWGAGKALGAVGQGFGALGAQAGAGAAGAAGGAAPVINGHTGAAHVFGSSPGITAATSAAPDLMGSMSPYLPAAGLAAAGLFAGSIGAKQKEKEDLKQYYEDKEENERKKRRTFESLNEPIQGDIFGSQDAPQYAHRPTRLNYKKGGKVIGVEIVGKGTGQSDDIPKTVPENSWVWDATTVAHAGDGTTNAGQKALKKFEQVIKKEKLPNVKGLISSAIKQKPLRNVPCALSNGERVTPPHLVAAAGDGCFDKGAAVLRKMTKELRRHKASKGLDLPPSAHDLTVYYKKALRGE